MAHFQKITFKLNMKELPDDPALTKTLNKIGKYRFKELKANRREAFITGEAESSKVVDSLAKALNANADPIVYHFDFPCKGKTLETSYEDAKDSSSFTGVKAEVTVREGKITHAKGTATSEPNLKELWRFLKGR